MHHPLPRPTSVRRPAKSIQNFKCKDTQALFFGHGVAKWRTIERVAMRKLAQLDWSVALDDLRIPPGNHLEA